jgi:Protein of unknown function (DUF4050)
MNFLQFSPELWRFVLLLAILIYHKTAYKLVARFLDSVTSKSSESSKSSSSLHLNSQDSSERPASPDMSSFHRRFLSSASTSAPEKIPGAEAADRMPSNNSEAARSAKRLLLSVVRDDWTYPPVEPQSTLDSVGREPFDYRIREEGSSDAEALSDEPYDARDPMVFTDSDPYKFENPDSVAITIGERKRKRRRLLKDELGWNMGLRTWVDRRNAWCGAVEQRPEKPMAEMSNTQDDKCERSPVMDSSIPLSPLSQMSASSSSVLRSGAESEEDGELDGPEEDQGPLLPVYPSLLPEDNLIRCSIKPTMYPVIYSKVVLQSLTPTVPVRLPDMIGALVQGWKSEGNWPPKSAVTSASIIQEGGRRTSELLKFRRRENAVAEKGRMRKSVGAVKKVLGLRNSNEETHGEGLKFENAGSTTNSIVDQSGLVEDDSKAPG